MPLDKAEIFDLGAKVTDAPSWQEADHCSTCSRVFNTLLRRHHCRYCGLSFCDAAFQISKYLRKNSHNKVT